MNLLMMCGCLMLVVTLHEYGHFRMLKKFGITSPDFSIGFGSRLWGFHHQGTDYNIRMIPLGGFIRPPEDYQLKLTKWQNIRVSFAGPWANVLTAIPFGVFSVLMVANLEKHHWLYVVGIAVVGTFALFLVAIPLTVFGLSKMFYDPTAFVRESDSVVGMLTKPDMFESASYPALAGMTWYQEAALLIYLISISMAAFNMLPLGFLDGGKIFEMLFMRHQRFLYYWRTGTTVLLVVVVMGVILGDVLQAIGLM